jgi:putative acetyltransferase
VHIRIDDLRGPEIAELLAAHIAFCRASSPPESTHVLDLDTLRSPEITFWSAWEGASLLGCAALKELDPAHGEVKSMHTAVRQRGRGVGLALLHQVVAEARSRGYRRLSLRPAPWRRSRRPVRSTNVSDSSAASPSPATASIPTACS